MPISLSRRSLFKSTAVAGAALATPQIMTRAAFADGHAAAAKPAGFNPIELGDLKVTVISDGFAIRENPQSIFGTNVSVEEVEGLLTQNYLPTDKMQFTFAPTVVEAGDNVILFDTGLGEGARGGGLGQTRANVEAAGYAPDAVTHVVLTHMHPDHIGGLSEGGAPAYPNAVYVAGEAEYGFWSDDARKGTGAEGIHTQVVDFFGGMGDKLTLIGGDTEIAPGIMSKAAFGHTAGHMIYMLSSGDKTMAITADTANHFVLSLQRPDWEVRFDADKAAAAQARKDVFGMLAADRIPFVGYHMPFPSVGFVEALGDGYRWIPETYQLDI
ncbi:MAG: MBL fold metallo-hydrolase [Pseudomonadota bacterium]